MTNSKARHFDETSPRVEEACVAAKPACHPCACFQPTRPQPDAVHTGLPLNKKKIATITCRPDGTVWKWAAKDGKHDQRPSTRGANAGAATSDLDQPQPHHSIHPHLCDTAVHQAAVCIWHAAISIRAQARPRRGASQGEKKRGGGRGSEAVIRLLRPILLSTRLHALTRHAVFQPVELSCMRARPRTAPTDEHQAPGWAATTTLQTYKATHTQSSTADMHAQQHCTHTRQARDAERGACRNAGANTQQAQVCRCTPASGQEKVGA